MVVAVVVEVVGESGNVRVAVIESVIIDAVGVMKTRTVIRTVGRIDTVLGLLCRLSVVIAHIGVGGMIGTETTVVMTGIDGTGTGIAGTEMIGIETTVIRADTGIAMRGRTVGIRTTAVHHRLPVDRTLIDSVHQRATATTENPATSTAALETHTVETAHPTAQAQAQAQALPTTPKPKT